MRCKRSEVCWCNGSTPPFRSGSIGSIPIQIIGGPLLYSMTAYPPLMMMNLFFYLLPLLANATSVCFDAASCGLLLITEAVFLNDTSIGSSISIPADMSKSYSLFCNSVMAFSACAVPLDY